jgi:hypothetical protein
MAISSVVRMPVAEFGRLKASERELAALRLALREPSDELLDRLIGAVPDRCLFRTEVRTILAALAEAVTPDGK